MAEHNNPKDQFQQGQLVIFSWPSGAEDLAQFVSYIGHNMAEVILFAPHSDEGLECYVEVRRLQPLGTIELYAPDVLKLSHRR
jgi:hypothetical protein